ncbi:GAF domain-containing protein [Metallibacterium scheffleri]|uniref:GAF domain-containing protein n=2 Tax=Metallibacterium TaxID=1218803 RepID=UPI0026EEBFFA|nr:GAF domain-containing protein [Metallibacterium scheffleri]MBW8074107.1 GAF domain-containing protein [Metallibacterium scheffleri]
MNSHTAVIVPDPGIPLPKALEPGDRVDLAATPRSTRTAIGRQLDDILPVGRTYEFAIRRGRAIVTVPVRTVDASTSTSTGVGLWEWGTFCSVVLLGGIALLASWRGRDRAAAGLALWAIANVFGFAAGLAPLDGRLGLSAQLGSDVLDLLARVGFYMMVESMAGAALTPRSRALWRASFLLLLGAGAVATLGGILVFIASGWAEFLLPQYGFVLTASYFVPVALLFANYRHADGAHRLRLRWMLWSSVVLVTSVFLYSTQLLGPFASDITTTLLLPIAMAGFLYAVLRHRVIDVAVVLNRGLVYAATTSLVLGLFALLESLIERTTLGHDADLLLELAVPLGLGAALSTVHRRIEAVVERFFFRRQYRAETALRRFAEECAFITQPENLFDLTVEQIARHAGAPRVALYERTAEAYIRIRQHGAPALPEQVATDDLAFVKLRARNAELDLNGTQSALGADGYAFPLMVRGSLLGALVVDQRPGEHFAADERELLFHVAHEVGMALFALRAQESETRTLASEARSQASEARALASEARSQANEARARTSEALLMETLRAVGSTART